MQTGVLNRNGGLILGLCALIASCGGPLQDPAGDEYASTQTEVSEGAPPRGVPEDLAPDSAEYERAKIALAAPPTPGPGPVEESVSASPAFAGNVAPKPASESLAALARTIIQDPGCLARVLDRNDDGSTPRISLPFSINFFGATFDSLFINNNGNVTFNSPMSTFTPFTIGARTPPIIAPFFADVDTRNAASGVVQFSNAPILFEGRRALCVNWVRVGYFSAHADKLNSSQLLLVDRNDTGVGNFDIIMNYNQILWEAGDASGGIGGLGGVSAGAGFSAGNGDPAAFFQFPGSLVHGGLLDSNGATGLSRTSHFSTVIGRHIFAVRSGQPITDERITLAPPSATAEVGGFHTVTATLINDQGVPLANRAVTFRILSGPNSSLPATVVTSNSSGQAFFTYAGTGGVGQDRIQGSFVKSTGQNALSDVATVDWNITARPPVALCQNVTLVANDTCGASASIDNGSFDPDGDLAGCTQSPGPTYGLGSTLVTLTCTDRRGLTDSCTGVVTVLDTTAPILACPADQTAECVAGAATVDTGPATATDNCGTPIISTPGLTSYPLGSSLATYSAIDSSGNSSSCSVQVTVVDTLAPAIALQGAPTVTLQCGEQSYVEPGATALDLCNGDLSELIAIRGTVDAQVPGSYPIHYDVADHAGHAAPTQTRIVNVVDTNAPQVVVAPTIQLWPPDHGMHSFQLSDCASTSDTCAGSGDVDVLGTITSISSDEPEDADGNGDGHTLGDIVITGSSSFSIRSEREGRGNGRVYSVNFVVTDGNGNATAATCRFDIPHDNSGERAVDDGAAAGYTVSAFSSAAPH